MSRNIEDTALRYLSSRSRTGEEMRSHLTARGFASDEIAALIKKFEDLGYLDDEQYCREYFRYALGKGRGKRRIFYELRQKGVDPAVAENVFEDYLAEEDLQYDEKERAFAAAEKILSSAALVPGDPIPEKVLSRIARKLQAEGYGSEVIFRVIGDLRK